MQQKMYAPKVNSPFTELANAIDKVQTVIDVVDGTKLPDAPNIVTIGTDEDAETILYLTKVGNQLSDVTRAFQGNAKAWGQGVTVARLFTAYDLSSLQQNHMETQQELTTHKAEKATDTTLGHVTLQQLGMRNVLINGRFGIWQRGTSFAFSLGGVYTADRWKYNQNQDTANGGGATISRQTFPIGQTELPHNPEYFIRAEMAAPANPTVKVLQQWIESVYTFAGEQVTVSFYTKADKAHKAVVDFHQYFGDAGSPTVSVGKQTIDVETVWKKFVLTFNIPSVAGKTVGRNNSLILSFRMFDELYNADQLYALVFDLADVQVERGDIATPIDRRHKALELALCQRYFCKTYGLNAPPATAPSGGVLIARANGAGSGRALANFRFPVEMRTAPSIITYSPNTGAVGKAYNATTGVDIDASLLGLTSSGVVLSHTTSISDSDSIHYHVTADAEL